MTTKSQYGSGAYGADQYGNGTYITSADQLTETTAVNNALRPVPPPVFTGMKLQRDVVIGDLVLNSIDANNVLWVCTDIEGWWSHPDPEIPDIPRGWGDGSYDSSGRWAARQLTLSGVILPPAPEYLQEARNTFIEQLNLVRRGVWLMTHETPTRAAFVRLSGRPELSTVNPRGRTEFSVGLRAADPIKYSWNQGDPDGYDYATLPCANSDIGQSGSVTITNIGNTPVTMFISIEGSLTGPATITNTTTNQTLTISEALRDSTTLTVTLKKIDTNVATLTTAASHALVAGDTVVIADVDATFNGTYTVVSTPSATTFTYALTATNVTETAATGTVFRAADALEINTYNKLVSFNGSTVGARLYVSTLTDWLTLDPGANVITFTDTSSTGSTAVATIHYRSGWIG